MKKIFVCTLMALMFTNLSCAKRFSNGYTEFELPPGWSCVIEGSEWVCQSENKERKKEAIIILAAKKRGPQDTLVNYQKYLKDTKSYQLPGAKLQKSQPKYANNKTINGHQWIDALHLASEVPGFYTRYLATVKADIGVAVTFSVTKSLYNAYEGIFEKVIATLRVFRQQNTNLANLKLGKGKGNSTDNFEDTTFVPEENFDIGAATTKKRDEGEGKSKNLMIFIAIGVVAAIVLLKLKK